MFVEGSTDAEYLSVLLPRLIEDLAALSQGRLAQVPDQPVEVFGVNCRRFDEIAERICHAREAITILFVHSDTGGRAIEERLEDRTLALCTRLHELCEFPTAFCIPVAPRKELEAWCLADRKAIQGAFGLSENACLPGVPERPAAAEHLADPKNTMNALLTHVRGARRRARRRFPYAAVAQAQDLATLRSVPSFLALDNSLRRALREAGFRDL